MSTSSVSAKMFKNCRIGWVHWSKSCGIVRSKYRHIKSCTPVSLLCCQRTLLPRRVPTRSRCLPAKATKSCISTSKGSTKMALKKSIRNKMMWAILTEGISTCPRKAVMRVAMGQGTIEVSYLWQKVWQLGEGPKSMTGCSTRMKHQETRVQQMKIWTLNKSLPGRPVRRFLRKTERPYLNQTG